MQSKSKLLEQLFYQYRYLMYHVAYEVLNDHALAEDAVQEAFLMLNKKSFKIDNISSSKTKSFMVIVIRNISLNIYRKRISANKNTSLYDQLADSTPPAPSPLDQLVSNEAINSIKKTINSLDPKYADILKLKYLYGYEDKKIAEILLITEVNVRVRLHRAKKILAIKLAKEAQLHEKRRTKRPNTR